MADYDAVVIGGGVVGTSTAYHLVRSGAKTLLVDRADVGQATYAGAGILSPETNSRDPEAWFNLALEAASYYSTLITQLQAEQEHDTGYAQCGALVVAVSEDELEQFEEARQTILSRQERRGLPLPDDLRVITSDEARSLFPALAPVHGAIFNRRACRVDGNQLNRALLAAAEGHGLSVRQASAERLVLEQGVVSGVVIDGKTFTAGVTAISGGAWSEMFGAQLGVQIPVQPQRGQIIHLGLADTDTSSWPIVSAFHGHYLVPWPDSRVVAGATRETGAGFQPHSTTSGVHEVLGEAMRVAPGLAPAEVLETRIGLRPLTADTMPVLGDLPGWSGIYLATGHGPTGLMLGPISGKLVAEMMLGGEPSADISAFHVSRFQTA